VHCQFPGSDPHLHQRHELQVAGGGFLGGIASVEANMPCEVQGIDVGYLQRGYWRPLLRFGPGEPTPLYLEGCALPSHK
jgi:hypothetical protein